MPIFEHVCDTPGCVLIGHIEEHYFARRDTPNPTCPGCGATQRRLLPIIHPVFVGAITARYNDKASDRPHEEGHYAYKVRSSRNVDGTPERVFIDSWQKQREFCKAEGLVNPKELPSHVEMSADGKTMKSNGLPGQWV
jgi:predicted nucleic acid-binding Zn ribbon protein